MYNWIALRIWLNHEIVNIATNKEIHLFYYPIEIFRIDWLKLILYFFALYSPGKIVHKYERS